MSVANAASASSGWARRAQPLLGTLVEIGVAQPPQGVVAQDGIRSAFAAIEHIQSHMSRFLTQSDIGRFNQALVGDVIPIHSATQEVLRFAQDLHQQTDGQFDIACGSGQWGLQVQALHKAEAQVQLDLGGLAKGYAVDKACQALQAAGIERGWVNAGGDVRCFGMMLPLVLRDEEHGGVTPWLELTEAAMATSYYGALAAAQLYGAPRARHVSVQAPHCLWADALTKVVALQGYLGPHLSQRYQAQAWIHQY